MGSKIEWTDFTWNPITGCTPVSAGCQNCYARAMHTRLQAMFPKKYDLSFNEVKVHWEEFDKPFIWKQPRKIFVCSMSDLFHEEVPDDAILKMFNVAREQPQHTFQLLTKRAKRLPDFNEHWPDNVWVGVSVENEANNYRLKYLKEVAAEVKFVSFEPFLFQNDLNPWPLWINNLDWVIAGGETGISYRWAFDEADKIKALRNACVNLNIPFFFKQWHKKGDRRIDGREWNQFPKI